MGLLIFILGTIGALIGLYGMFRKAGVQPWKALIPYYNTWVMVDLMKMNKIWFFLQFIPVAGQFITIAITIDFVKHFGRFNLIDHALVVFAPFVYLPYVGYSKQIRYIGPEKVKLYKKSVAREWIDAAVFAIVAATIIRTFVFEAYTIPTPSMERTLLVNDFLFVSKFSYGPRIPNTPLSFPFVHNTLPFTTSGKSYLEWIHWPYKRILASPVQRKDVVVFNFPVGDTVIDDPAYQSEKTYYQECREIGRDKVLADPDTYPIIVRPVDKQENFIKRCTGIAGDTLSVVHGEVFINGVGQGFPAESEMFYNVTVRAPFSDDYILDSMKIDVLKDSLARTPNMVRLTDNQYLINMSTGIAESVRHLSNVASVVLDEQKGTAPDVFPYDTVHCKWDRDNYGPLWIPSKGATLTLTDANISIYRRAIQVYEGNDLEEKNGQFYINGQATTTYTFKMNYYWMMGDNRHNSLDSRYWGFVPEDHVVGRASMIWMSYNTGPRWNRMMRLIH